MEAWDRHPLIVPHKWSLEGLQTWTISYYGWQQPSISLPMNYIILCQVVILLCLTADYLEYAWALMQKQHGLLSSPRQCESHAYNHRLCFRPKDISSDATRSQVLFQNEAKQSGTEEQILFSPLCRISCSIKISRLTNCSQISRRQLQALHTLSDISRTQCSGYKWH